MIAKIRSWILRLLHLEPSEVPGDKPPPPREIARDYVLKVNRGVVVPSSSSEHRLLTVSQAYLQARMMLTGCARELREEIRLIESIPSARRFRINALLDLIQRTEDL